MILFILLLYNNFFKSTAGLLCNNIALAGQGKPRIEAQQSRPSVLESGVPPPPIRLGIDRNWRFLIGWH